MGLKIVDLTPENINELYPESEGFPRPYPVDGYNRKLAWVKEMLTKGFQRKVAFNEAGSPSTGHLPSIRALITQNCGSISTCIRQAKSANSPLKNYANSMVFPIRILA
jgi:hypothetical protein